MRLMRPAVVIFLGVVVGVRADQCPVASYNVAPQCARAATGCICTYDLMVTEHSYADCGGCYILVNGSRDCNLTGGAGDKTYNDVVIQASCNGGGFKLDDCPCTGLNTTLGSVNCEDC